MITDGPQKFRTVLFIAGLTHSGSTLLDLLLGRTRSLIGLGEVVPLLRRESTKLGEEDRLCSCGNTVTECRFWSHVSREHRLYPHASFENRYASLLEIFDDVFGTDRVPVDSSKSLRALQAVSSLPGLEIGVIHLLRDVRGWVVSRRDVDIRVKARVVDNASRETSLWRDNAYARFLIWYYGNKKIIQFTDEMNLNRITIGYEALVFKTDFVVSRLLSNFSIDDAVSTNQGESRSHILLGNRMRLNQNKEAVNYDSRWFTRSDWVVPSLVFRRVMAFNTQWVYKSTDKL